MTTTMLRFSVLGLSCLAFTGFLRFCQRLALPSASVRVPMLIGLALAIAPTAALHGQSSGSPSTAVDVSKIKRYLNLGMYREAIQDLEPAVKSDEFNSDLRLLYGTALRHVRRYDDSLYNLSIAIKLDSSNWSAMDETLKVYMERYAESPANSDRISASKAATQMISMRGSETDRPELKEAKQRAEEVIVRFEDPVGLWRNDRHEFEITRQPQGKFWLKEHPASGQKCDRTCLTITFERTTPQAYEGSGSNSDSTCIFDFSYELSFSDAATRLSVKGKHVRYRVPDLTVGSSDIDALRTRNKMCAAMVRDGVFIADTDMALERTR